MKIFNCSLTVLSPLHIGGSASEANTMEFYYDRKQKYLYHVSEKKIAAAFKGGGLTEDFLNFMNSGEGSLEDYLVITPYIPRESIREMLGGRKISLKTQVGRIKTFRPLLQDPLSKRPYIPGSSIKGALRTVALLMLLDRDAYSHKEIERAVERSKFKDRQRVGKSMVRRLLETAELEHTKSGPHRDWLRSLKVSDAFCEDPEPSSIREVKVVSLNKNGKGYHWGAKGNSIFIETIDPGTTFYFTMEIDRGLLDMMGRFRKPLFDPEELFDNTIIKKYVSEPEQRFWKQCELPSIQAKEQQRFGGTCLKLGWGSGYLNTTIGAYLSENVRLQIGQKFYRSRYNIFPNSRKVIVENGAPVDTLGWCKLEKV